MEVQLQRSEIVVELVAGAPTIEATSGTITVELSAPHLDVVLEVEQPQLVFQTGPVVQMTVPVITVELNNTAGAQGPPGPQQIFVQDAEPSGSPPYPLLWFDTDAFGAGAPAQMKVWRP